MLLLHVPVFEELWFRQKMLADGETMSYNSAWGGAIHFSREKWTKWYDRWITNTEGKRFYRYLLHEETGIFVGEIAYHLDEAEGIWLSDVIIHAAYRGEAMAARVCVVSAKQLKKMGSTFCTTTLPPTIRP